MKTIELTEEQRDELLYELSGLHNECGKFSKSIEIGDDMVVEAEGYIEIEACQDSDTGVWMEIYRQAWVELKAIIYNENGCTTECYVDAATEQAAADCLNEAA